MMTSSYSSRTIDPFSKVQDNKHDHLPSSYWLLMHHVDHTAKATASMPLLTEGFQAFPGHGVEGTVLSNSIKIKN